MVLQKIEAEIVTVNVFTSKIAKIREKHLDNKKQKLAGQYWMIS